MCQLHAVQDKPSPWLRGSHHPISPMQIRFSDLQVLVFEESMCHTASPTHCLSPVADHSTPSRHGIGSLPAVIHPQPTLQAEELFRRALTGREGQLGPVHPHTLSSVRNLAILLEVKGSVTEAMPACVVAWGGSAWRGCRCGKLMEDDGS